MQESISILKGGHALQEGLARELEMVKKSIYGETSRLMIWLLNDNIGGPIKWNFLLQWGSLIMWIVT